MDYITYQNIYNTPLGTVQAKADKKLTAIKSLEGAVLRNYVFENQGGYIFSNQSEAWGLDSKGISHGAVYADLDNDGDLEVVVNNTNEEAYVYENKSNEIFKRNYLRIKLEGADQNRDGIGAKITTYHHRQKKLMEHFLNRGYESTVDGVIHIGLDTLQMIDSLQVIWPDGRYQLLKKVKTNQVLTLKYNLSTPGIQPENNPDRLPRRHKELTAQGASAFAPIAIGASVDRSAGRPKVSSSAPLLFTEVSKEKGINYTHQENDYVDFKVQPLLPHMHSKNGPGIAVADVNGDGLEDFYVGGATGHSGALFLQRPDGKFRRGLTAGMDSLSEDMGVLFFDADGDKDMDLYIASGGSEQLKGSPLYSDHLYLNDGRGNFSYSETALPETRQSGSSVVAADYDRDGDLDLFIGGRIIPGEYPLPADSYIFRNDTDSNRCRFTDVTKAEAPELLQ